MDDDKLLKALAQVAKEERNAAADRLDERWDRLSAGTLEPKEEAALRALAETSDEARQAYEAFRPLDADFRARMVSTLAARLDAAPTGSMAAPAAEPRTAGAPRAGIRLFDRWQSWWGRGFVATAAAAAAVFAFLMVRGPGELPPLPEYGLALEGGVEGLRSRPLAGGTERLFVPGNRFELVLRPATAVSGPVAVRFFLAAAGEPQAVELPAEISADGAVRVVGEIGREIAIGPGEWILWAVVGRPAALADEDELRSALRQPAAPQSGRVVLRTAFRVAAEPP